MERKIRQEKNIVEEKKDNKTKIILFPCEGVIAQEKNMNTFFKVGDDISKYQSFEYEYISKTIKDNGECYDADRYDFIQIPLVVWTDEETGDKYIDLIRCDTTCTWKNKELIGMFYENFTKEFQLIPDLIDKQWSPGPYENGRNYDIYIFDSLGLMLWVWRKRIRQILISIPSEESEE